MRIITIFTTLFIAVQVAIAQETFHPADTNQDWRISAQEFEAYNQAWQQKKSWPEGPVPILMDYVTRAGYLVSNEKQYMYDATRDGTLRWEFRTITNSFGMTFNYIVPGTFMMGSPPDEYGRSDDEIQHEVTLTKGYFIQTTEITQEQWVSVMGSYNPSYNNHCGDCPVENIKRKDTSTNIYQFIEKLNQKEGTNKYRLPTEAEWEYAARAGSTSAIADGVSITDNCYYDEYLDAIAWYCGNSDSKTHPVAQKRPNAWGLYDMHGNVAEMCQDFYGDYPEDPVIDPTGSSGSYYDGWVYRGGSFHDTVQNIRSAKRAGLRAEYSQITIGARLAFFNEESK